jgi:uncharacterized membrane protein
MNKILTIFIGFVHDFAAGCWAATVFAVYWLDRRGQVAETAALLLDLQKQFFFIGLACVLAVFITGAGRSFTYVGNVYGKDAELVRRKMLIQKHIVLFFVFGAGIFWQYSLINW